MASPSMWTNRPVSGEPGDPSARSTEESGHRIHRPQQGTPRRQRQNAERPHITLRYPIHGPVRDGATPLLRPDEGDRSSTGLDRASALLFRPNHRRHPDCRRRGTYPRRARRFQRPTPWGPTLVPTLRVIGGIEPSSNAPCRVATRHLTHPQPLPPHRRSR
jgi:hypothetical protein